MESTKNSLSSNVLQMKFMKRSALRIEKEKSQEERQHIIDDEHWVLDLPETTTKENRYITDPSYHRCYDFMFGRMSFKGFNPEIEKLMMAKNVELGLEEAEKKEKEIGLSDKEMAQRYENLVGTVDRKFTTKRQHRENTERSQSTEAASKSKRKFKRPADD